MKRTIIVLLVVVILTTASFSAASADFVESTNKETYTAVEKADLTKAESQFDEVVIYESLYPENAKRILKVTLDGGLLTLSTKATFVNNSVYVPIWDFAVAMGNGHVSWDRAAGKISVSTDDLSLEASGDMPYIVANGRYLYSSSGCFISDNTIYAPVRALCSAFGAQVEWIDDTSTVAITSGTQPILSGDDFYDSDDLYWLSRIIQAEAGGESLEGKIAVGNVVLNRVESEHFPDSVYKVIFDGIQFTPAVSGSIYRSPSEEAIIAAKIALDGGNTAGDSLFFNSCKISWASKNREHVATIGNHYFYA